MTLEIPGELESEGWMGSREHQERREQRVSRGPRGSRERQEAVELRASEGALGSQGTRGQRGQQDGLGSKGKRVTLVTLETQASQDCGDGRAMLAPGAFLEFLVQELPREKSEGKARRERRAGKVCWARAVSPELQDLLEPEDGLGEQDSEVLLGLMVPRERREIQGHEVWMELLALQDSRGWLEMTEQREMVASPAQWARRGLRDWRVPPGSGGTQGTREPEE